MQTGDDAHLIRLVGALYDAVLDPSLWILAIDGVRRRFELQNAALEVRALPSGVAAVQAVANIPADYMAGMAGYAADIVALWGGAAKLSEAPLEEPVLQSQMVEDPNYRENRYFREWAVPQGIDDSVGIALAHDRTMIGSLSFGHHAAARPIDEDMLSELRLLAPHIRRAVTISRVLDVAVTRANTFEAALEATRSGVALVDAEMGIVHANAVASEMLKRGDPIRSIAGRLVLRHEFVTGRLQGAVRVAADEEGQLGRRGIGIPTRLEDGTPLAVHVMPLNRRLSRGGLEQRAMAAVFVAENGAPPEVPIDMMAMLYDLTPAEQRVFELVVAGHASDEMAQRLGIAPSTVRTHLLRVFEKTDRHDRADLVRLAGEIRLPV